MRPPLRLSRRDLNSLFSPESPLIGLGRAPLLAPALSPGAEDTWILIQHLWPCSLVPPPPASRSPILGTPPPSPLAPLLPVPLSLLWPASWSPICTSLRSSFFLFSCPSLHLWAPPSYALPSTTLSPGPTTTATLTWGPRLALAQPSRPPTPARLLNSSPPSAMSNNMAKIAEARKTVEQLKLEVNIDRMKVSQAAAELLAFCETHAKDDPLVTPVPAAENPFRDKRLFCVLL
ncbi:guanine nucleotide-binding protein G(I)/G(S)/G(O) subunit gamma-8 isoform X1 [Mirounga angustirostris]